MLLTVAYDGTRFRGFQEQPGQRTVAGVLAAAVARMAGTMSPLRGASRTDAGVHALGQAVAFAAERDIAPDGWLRGLNTLLPEDVAIHAAAPCAPDYDPRHDAVSKRYRYLFHVGPVRDPLLRDRAWHLGPRFVRNGRLDLGAMREGARRLVGTHDFRAFRGTGDERENTTRTLLRVDLSEGVLDRADLLALDVEGTAFLKQMVRILAGTLAEAGRGRTEPDRIGALLGPDARRADAGPTAPPQGLTLIEVRLGRAAAASSG